jgi:argininosuccinate synthase
MAEDSKPDAAVVRRHIVADGDAIGALWRAYEELADAVHRVEQAQLRPETVKSIEDLVERDRWMRRTGTMLKTASLTIAAVVAGFTVGLDALKGILKRLLS